ncbi:hypothetical protein [Pseudorhodoferax sp.]|uniref:hypothetical protein n=1 Tax=Pseudorhodoferax sp. TaxID=1993553 RepID=UPI002DD65DA3|nr:hypothetical protein [Pseudorhodoferax sp.]
MPQNMHSMESRIVTITAPAGSQPSSGEQVSVLVPQERAWLAPLLEAVNDPGIAASTGKVARIITNWGGMPEQEEQPEHRLYMGYVLSVLDARMPWLLPLLDAACALVAVSPGVFTFMVRTRMGQHFDVPELIPFTHLLPWVSDGERERTQ